MKKMKGEKILEKSIKAIGYTSKGERKEFPVNRNGRIFCYNEDLVSLEIPKGVKDIWCRNNKLTELKLPEGLEYLNCHKNKLTELNIPKGVRKIWCDMSVLGLDKVDWDCNIRLY